MVNATSLALVIRQLYSIWRTVKARRQQKYERQVTHFEQLGVGNQDIVFLGDSLIAQADWCALFPERSIRNRGIGGDTTGGLLERLDAISRGQPKKIFLLIGTNDVGFGILQKQTVNNYAQILTHLQTHAPHSELYVQSILPRQRKFKAQIESINKQLNELCTQHDVPFIDLYPSFLDNRGQLDARLTTDGLHLLGGGYRRWQKLLTAYI